MEPTLAVALTKLVSGAAGSLGGKLASLVWKAATGDRRGLSQPETRVDLEQLENDLLAVSLTKERSLQMPSSSVYEFITSPVMRTFTEQLILIAFAGARPTLEKAMREEFRASMSAYLGVAAQDYRSLSDADVIFVTIRELTENAVVNLRRSGYRLAENALDRLHHLTLELYASSIERNTRLLSGFQREPIERNEHFLHRLSEQVAFQYRHIKPPDFEQVVRVPIEDLYVTPSLSDGIEPSPYAGRALNLGTFTSRIYRTVVLGDPGGGKSTLSAFLAHTIAKGKFAQVLFASKTPVIITLRHLRMSEQGPQPIFVYLQSVCESTYALQVPPSVFEYALLNGRLFLIFDGLDELLEPTERAKVVESIEAIGNLYPDTPILVTSRRINYNAAPLDPEMFEAYSLNEFDDFRIEDYAYRSFMQLEDKSEEESRETAKAFLRESRDHAAEIRSNPLLLALMCRLYRGEGYIPQNIPSLYQRCAELLFLKWDPRRRITSGLPFEYHIEPLMAYLAYEVFNGDKPVLRESELIFLARGYLREWLIPDPYEAEAVATRFVRYFKDRLWVFTEVGLTWDGESIYAFTHRTFLEYFAGKFVSTNAASSRDLAAELLPRLASKQWDIVAQVAIYLQSSAKVRAADEIIQYFLSAQRALPEDSDGGLLGFVNRLLAFVVPRPETLDEVVRATLEHSVSLIGNDNMRSFWSVLTGLVRARVDNRPGISRSIENYIRQILGESRETALFAVAIILQVPRMLEVSFVGDSSYAAELTAFWKTVAETVSDIAGGDIAVWGQGDAELALQAWQMHVLPLSNLIANHGLAVLTTIAKDLLRELADRPSMEIVQELEEWHDAVLSLSTPWFDSSRAVHMPIQAVMLYDVANSKKAFSSVALIMAALYESGAGDDLDASSLGDLDGLKDMLASRPSSLATGNSFSSLTELVTEDCLLLLSKWVTGQTNFVIDAH